MSRSTDVPQPVPAGETELWQGLEEWAQTPEFRDMLHREFPEDATAWADPVSRRAFLTIAGATAALAGVGCSPRMASREKIYPYVRQPDEITPGIPLFFATGFTLNGVTTGVLAKSREGRPIKLEGNPTHPGSNGGIDSITQASLLNLYDPDRSRQITRRNSPSGWESLVLEVRTALNKIRDQGKAIRILCETVNSPTLGAVLAEFERMFPTAKVVQWEPASRDNVREGARLAFGEPVNVIYDFAKALRVVALDSDFLVSDRTSTRYARDFSQNRRTQLKEGDRVPGENELNRLYVVESMLTATGVVADHRLPMRSADVEGFARALAAAVGVSLPGPAATVSPETQKWVAAIAKDLGAFRGRSAVIVGDHQSPAVHAIAHAINGALGNVGETVLVTAPIEIRSANTPADQTQAAAFKALVNEMNAGSVEALFILGGNPAYTAPADLKFADALGRVGLKVHLGSHLDETGVLCDWQVNEAHFLETWGDGKAYDGTVSICQPLIAPLFNGRSAIELLSAFLSEQAETSPREIVKFHWRRNWPANGGSTGGFDSGWQAALRDGVVPNTAAARMDKQPAPAGIPPYAAPAGGTEVNFRPDPLVHDGRFANNAWLQEVPKPVTKLTWDNAIIISPKMAATLGFGEERTVRSEDGKTTVKTRGPKIESTGGGEHGRTLADIGELTVGGRTVKGPVWIQVGHAEDSITVHLGYGRDRGGRVAEQARGFNVYPLRGSEAPWVATGAQLKKTSDEAYILASTQAHWNMEGRRPVRRANRAEFEKNYEAHKANPDTVAPFAKVPPAAAPEWKSIDENVPGSRNEWRGESAEEQLRGRHRGHDHDHDKSGEGNAEEKHAHAGEDLRMIPLTMVPATNKDGRRWAMSIDLTTCVGCTACVTACIAENNIPMVGKKEVTRGRAMHWIRVDRYYEGPDPNDAANLTTHFQPVPCQQCEKAPCEIVCPVAATMHSAEGLNDMVYNRCVGTRYCSNNCPYKVRRFNFLTFNDWKTDTYKLMRNPEVTVRERGVMEKCTYCVQRIRAAVIEAEKQGREVRDGEILTACQQACPAEAIVFGNLSDPKAKVVTHKLQPHTYGLLAELNTMPRTTYVATIRNPNPELVRA
jgi:MoCo/4Fe-4S cofactor protein with predicted Tat translocation signal